MEGEMDLLAMQFEELLESDANFQDLLLKLPNVAEVETLFIAFKEDLPDKFYLKLVSMLYLPVNMSVREIAVELLQQTLSEVEWDRLVLETREQIKSSLLYAVGLGTPTNLRRSICNFIAHLGEIVMYQGWHDWSELEDCICMWLQGGIFGPVFTETAYLILKGLKHRAADEHILVTIEATCMKHSGLGPKVLFAAMTSLIGFHEFVPEAYAHRMKNVLHLFISRMLTDIVPRWEPGQLSDSAAEEVLDELTDFAATHPVYIWQELMSASGCLLKIIETKDMVWDTRSSAIACLFALADIDMALQPTIRGRLFCCLLQMFCDVSEDGIPIDPFMFESARIFLDRWSHVLVDQSFESVLADLEVNCLISKDWRTRNAALLVLGDMSKARPEQLKNRLNKVVFMALNALKDSQRQVQMTALRAIQTLATNLTPDLHTRYHREVTSSVIAAMYNNVGQEFQLQATSTLAEIVISCPDALRAECNEEIAICHNRHAQELNWMEE